MSNVISTKFETMNEAEEQSCENKYEKKIQIVLLILFMREPRD